MRILISLNKFGCLTGSELHNLELSKSLSAIGHEVTIWSDLGNGELSKRAKKHGVECIPFTGLPEFNTFDIIHLQHANITRQLLDITKNIHIPVVCTIHSEIIPLEEPVIDDRIQKYICVRPSIKGYIVKKFGIREEQTVVIYNPINFEKFNSHNRKNNLPKNAIFVGTIDALRKNVILRLIEDSRNEGFNLMIVGNKNLDYLPNPLPQNVTWHKPEYAIENYYKMASESHSILLGRTAIEGWCSGIPAIIWDVDSNGAILGKTYPETPTVEELQKFNSKFVAKQIEAVYKEAIEKIIK